jgi:hypothetical protein
VNGARLAPVESRHINALVAHPVEWDGPKYDSVPINRVILAVLGGTFRLPGRLIALGRSVGPGPRLVCPQAEAIVSIDSDGCCLGDFEMKRAAQERCSPLN